MGATRVVIAGCGFLGEAAAFLFAGEGAEVLGICATAESAARLVRKSHSGAAYLTDLPQPSPPSCDFSELGSSAFSVCQADLTGSLSGVSRHWLEPEVLVHCASSGKGGAGAYRAIYRDGIENLLRFFRPGKVIFTGSTSVYSQDDGCWVDEQSPTDPSRETGQILLEAERIALESGGAVARLSGIYGPGRSVLLKKFLAGEAVLEAGGGRWLNQIHRDDAARALVLLAGDSVAGGIYNVSDDTPATQREVYGWIAAHYGLPLPLEGPPDFERKRGWTSKRVSNAKLRAAGWRPAYPDFCTAIPSLGGGTGE